MSFCNVALYNKKQFALEVCDVRVLKFGHRGSILGIFIPKCLLLRTLSRDDVSSLFLL